MAIYSEEEDTAVLSKPDKVVKNDSQYIDSRIQEPQRITDIGNYHSALINTRYVDVRSLLAHIPGSSWTVDYFYNVVDTDDETVQHDTDLGGAYQQYTRVVGLELKVQSAINPNGNWDEESNEFSPEGNAVLYGGFKPNVGNVFIADIGDGRLAEISVVGYKPLSIMKDTAYDISYIVTRYLDEEGTASLLAKTIRTFYFDLDDVLNGGNGLLTKNQVINLGYLEDQANDLVAYHLTTFYNYEIETLLVPTPTPTYDMFIPGILRDIVSVDTLARYPTNRELNCQDVDTAGLKTIWDVLIENNIGLFSIISKGWSKTSVGAFDHLPEFLTVMYSGVKEVIMPEKTYPPLEKEDPVPNPGVDEGFTRPLPKARMHPIHYKSGYIFSPHFYEKDYPNMSVFEVLVMDYLNNKIINAHSLIKFIKEVHTTWSDEQRFYLIPILLILINVSLQQKHVE